MKLTCTCIAVVCLLNAQPCFSQSSGSGMGIKFLPKDLPAPSGKVITDEQLKERLDKERFGGTQPAGSRPDHYSNEKFSDFLLIDGSICSLPKDAVLCIPENTGASLGKSAAGNSITFLDLLKTERSKVQTMEVTFDEVVGRKAIDPAKIERILASKYIIIATLKGNPISAPAVKLALTEAQNTKP